MLKDLRQAVSVLRKGGVVVYPTDTAYGLAVDATSTAAVKKLFRLKGRDFKNPIHIIPPTKSWIEKLVKLDRQAIKLIKSFFPGAITLVLPLKATGASWELLSAGTGTLGIRRPKYKLALDLAGMLGRPITTTSANVSGQPTNYSVPQIIQQFKGTKFQPDYYLNAGKLKKIKPSTVVLVTDHVKILRQGPISEQKIKRVLKK